MPFKKACPPVKRLYFFLGWFVSQQNHKKVTGTIFLKLDGRLKHGPRKKPFNFGVNQNPGADKTKLYTNDF